VGSVLTSLCYLQRDGNTLMINKTHGPQRGLWNGLGGKFEPGETPEACVRREVLEESGLTLSKLDYRGLLTFPSFAGDHDIYTFVFTSSDFRGSQRDSWEGRLAWVPDKDIFDLNLFDGDRVFLKWLNQERVFSARLSYKQGTFIGYEVEFYPQDPDVP
jgi:8-oxo-dGTP diphosphatase